MIARDANMALFNQWHTYYTDRFKRCSADSLQGYWYLFGRDSEQPLTCPRDLAAYAAVNIEMQERGLI